MAAFAWRLCTTLSVVVMFALLAGCAQDLPRTALSRGDKIVVVSALEPGLVNSHVGVTVFGTYGSEIENNWNLPDYAIRSVMAWLKTDGYDVSLAPLAGERATAIENQDIWNSLRWSNDTNLTTEASSWLSDLMSEYHASAVVVLTSSKRPLTNRSASTYSGYGILSGWGRKPATATLFATTTAYVFAGHPPVRKKGVSASDANCARVFHTDKLPVDNMKEVTATMLEPYRSVLESMISARLAQDLNTSGLLREASAPCGLSEI